MRGVEVDLEITGGTDGRSILGRGSRGILHDRGRVDTENVRRMGRWRP